MTKNYYIIIVVGVLGLIIATSLTIAADSSVRQAEGKSVLIVSIGDVDQVLAQRVCNFVTGELECNVRFAKQSVSLKNVPHEDAKELANLMEKNDVCLLAIVSVPKDYKVKEFLERSINVAILNLSGLFPSVGNDKGKAQEAYARRIEKESMNLIGRLLGLEACSLYACALSIAETEPELDAKGRNYCPPCQAKIEKALKDKGVILNSER